MYLYILKWQLCYRFVSLKIVNETKITKISSIFPRIRTENFVGEAFISEFVFHSSMLITRNFVPVQSFEKNSRNKFTRTWFQDKDYPWYPWKTAVKPTYDTRDRTNKIMLFHQQTQFFTRWFYIFSDLEIIFLHVTRQKLRIGPSYVE